MKRLSNAEYIRRLFKKGEILLISPGQPRPIGWSPPLSENDLIVYANDHQPTLNPDEPEETA